MAVLRKVRSIWKSYRQKVNKKPEHSNLDQQLRCPEACGSELLNEFVHNYSNTPEMSKGAMGLAGQVYTHKSIISHVIDEQSLHTLQGCLNGRR